MENTSNPSARSAPTTLDLLTRGGVASPAYLDVERTLDRARAMLGTPTGGSIRPSGLPIAAIRGLETRLRAHAEQLFADHVHDVATTLPGGITTRIRAWDSDTARLTYRLLLTYRQQAEERITDEQCRSVIELMPSRRSLLDGAQTSTEPHRNHSRHEPAQLWSALACPACTLRYLDSINHPTGCIFVGWGHGWQACSDCGGSGLSAVGRAARDARAPVLPDVVLCERTAWTSERHHVRERFEVRGGDVTDEWSRSLRVPCAPWCSVIIWDESVDVGGYGGEVWPSAWPGLFLVDGPKGRPRTRLTETGAALFEAARLRGAP